MFTVVLYEPEIAPNTGNIIRLCANTGANLKLVEPLGFEWDDKRLRRAGLDYAEFAEVQRCPDLDAALAGSDPDRVVGLTTKATMVYTDWNFRPGDTLLFGPETRGLPEKVRHNMPDRQLLRLPMQAVSRSLNLSNAVAVVVFEGLRQNGFEGLS